MNLSWSLCMNLSWSVNEPKLEPLCELELELGYKPGLGAFMNLSWSLCMNLAWRLNEPEPETEKT